MSEFSLSSTTSKKTHFSSLLLSDLFLFCSFILSHPIYFFYLVFLSPYLFKILSFLSPLFITTFLLLLVLLTVSPNLVLENLSTELPEYKVSFVLGTYRAVVERLQSKFDEDGKGQEFNQFVELEAYKIVFESSNYDIGENPVQVSELEAKENIFASNEAQVVKSSSHESSVHDVSEMVNGNVDENENSVVITRPESSRLIEEEKKLGVLLHQKQKFEEFASQKEEEEVKPLSENSNKVEEKKEETYMRSGSKATSHKQRESKVSADYDSSREYISRMNSHRLEGDFWSPDNSLNMGSNLGSFGSMRKEKEWRRTLACKLFEERHNVDGVEGMDMLWETHETDSTKVLAKSKTTKGKKGKIGNFYYDDDDDVDEEEKEEEDEEDESNGKLCCLQALKFSAGKMNLGMGRPNLVKISKAIKGIGWLHNVTKHGKKSYH